MYSGPAVKEFEAKMASKCARRYEALQLRNRSMFYCTNRTKHFQCPRWSRHAIACANGTAALDIAVKAGFCRIHTSSI